MQALGAGIELNRRRRQPKAWYCKLKGLVKGSMGGLVACNWQAEGFSTRRRWWWLGIAVVVPVGLRRLL